MANSILDNVEYSENDGAITFKDVRYMLIRPDTVVDFQKAVEAELGDRTAEMMMAGGFTGGLRSSRRYKEVFDYSDEEIVAFMCNMGREIGWGDFEVEEFDQEGRRLVVLVRNSAFAEAYGNADRGVCHLIRGVMAGMAAGIFGGDVRSEETQCRAKGDDQCRFVIVG
ncbi:MAG: 4-vinyl reductase [Anaerolineae bacterium]|nr:4-vinyl reductase [Anaerolineae bacterium]